MNKQILFAGLIPILGLASCNEGQKGHDSKNEKPNIIFIMADDLGYGDLGCYGQTKIQTPNINKLAEQGMLFTQFYSGSAVCAPARSTLMTGMHTGHTWVRGNKATGDEGDQPLGPDVFTVAQLMKNAGYATGAFGKWGLGMADTPGGPNQKGFDEFFGYLCQRQAHRYYPEYLWHNDQKYYLEGNDWAQKQTYSVDVIHDKTLNFIKANKDKPFFLYVPSIIPHAELIAPDDQYLEMFKGKFEETPWGVDNPARNPYEGNDYGSEDFEIFGYAPQPAPRAVFAAMVSRLDAQVGEIMDLLDELGLAENTLILFTSDNGAHQEGGADPDFFDSNGLLRGYKRDLYEGGIRVPMIARWPEKIKAGSRSEHMGAFYDLLPTLAEMTGQSLSVPTDGLSFLPALSGEGNQQTHEYLYWEFHERNGRQAIRKGDWKLVKYDVLNEDCKTELFHLSDDPEEKTDLAEKHPEMASELENLLMNARTPSEIFPFNPVKHKN